MIVWVILNLTSLSTYVLLLLIDEPKAIKLWSVMPKSTTEVYTLHSLPCLNLIITWSRQTALSGLVVMLIKDLRPKLDSSAFYSSMIIDFPSRLMLISPIAIISLYIICEAIFCEHNSSIISNCEIKNLYNFYNMDIILVNTTEPCLQSSISRDMLWVVCKIISQYKQALIFISSRRLNIKFTAAVTSSSSDHLRYEINNAF